MPVASVSNVISCRSADIVPPSVAPGGAAHMGELPQQLPVKTRVQSAGLDTESILLLVVVESRIDRLYSGISRNRIGPVNSQCNTLSSQNRR
jgi:hypothetical protein